MCLLTPVPRMPVQQTSPHLLGETESLLTLETESFLTPETESLLTPETESLLIPVPWMPVLSKTQQTSPHLLGETESQMSKCDSDYFL